MVRYAFDLYPRTDPRDGAVIRRFEHLQEASYRGEENGTGSGQLKVAGDSPDGEDIDPRGLQYIRVIEIDDSDVETVKGGFWLEQGKFQALTRRETKHLEFGGAGTLAYLQRAVMWSRTYINEALPGFIGQDPIGTTWDLANQSTFYANGNHLGAMLWRVVTEAQLFPTGDYTHRHFDFGDTGITHTGTHDDDRSESAIPDLVMTFDQNEDSDGNPWTLTAGTFTAQVGESVLSVTRRLMELGLKVEMDPDTFELHAWEAPHRTDRTSTAWASGKVLFTAPTAEDIATGNILSDTIRTIRAFIQRSIVLAGSDNVYAISEGATDIPWEGGYRFDTEDTTTAGDVAARQRLARSDAVDNLKVVMKLGNAPLEGRYRPWVHVNPGDLVTVDTGSDQWEFDNTTFPVAALTVELKQGGDWRAIAELGSSFTSLLEPAFQVGGAPAHTHPPNPQLCLPGTAAVGGTPECFDGDDGDHTETIPAHLSQPEFTTPAWQNETTAGYNHPEQYYWRFALSGNYTYFPADLFVSGNAEDYSLGAADPGDEIRFDFTHRFEGSFPSTKTFRFRVEWLSDDYDGSARTVVGTSDYIATCTRQLSSHSFSATAPTGTVAFRIAGGVGDGHQPWNMHDLCVTGAGTAATVGDGHALLVGHSSRAARCDHSHTFYADRAPAVTDDESEGFIHLGIRWVNTVTGEEWRLDDTTDGAAVWTLTTVSDDASTLAALEDVDLTTTPPADGDALVWDDTNEVWVPAAVAGGGIPDTIFDAQGDLVVASAADTAARLARGTDGQVLRSTASTVAWEDDVSTLNAVIDGGGSVITTGVKGDVVVDFDCTIVSVTMLADVSGDVVVDIWKDTYGNYPPTDADSITAAAVPTISSATKSQDTTLTGWTTSISAGQTLRFNVDSATTITRVTVALKLRRS